MRKKMPYMVLDITKKPGDTNAVKTGEMLLAENTKLREAVELIVNERGILDFCHNNLGSKKWEDLDKVYKTLRRWIDKTMSALSSPPRNCDRPECATTKAAQDVWRKEDGGKTAYYEWLLATYKKGDNDGNE